ncbi:PxKF domain-containing protein [Intrasporangium sp. DVR]|uniref:PxKF domain-containing protein n=1 Tax=Intrasporangium sp. DVR TaxID=3127867 RepID=UPI00313A6AD9
MALTLFAGTTAAVADVTEADGDGVTPVAASSLDLGTICTGSTISDTALVAISRNGNYGSTSVFKAETSASVTVLGVSGNGLSASVRTPGTIAIPVTWAAAPNNTMTGSVISDVTLTPSTAGAFTGSVTYRSTGTSSRDGSELTKDDEMTVTAIVEDCLPSDTTAPAITPNITGTLGNNGWYVSNVTVSWTVTDSESTVTSPGCPPTTISADTTGQVVSCSATSAGGSSSNSVTIKRDTTAPSVSLVGGPAAGGSYYFGSVPAAPTCTASDATSGLAGPCSVSGYSTAVGSPTVMASATDLAGNSASASAAYQVLAWNLERFYQPVDMNALNIVKGGSTVPLKFEVFAGPTELTDVSVVDTFKAGQVGCGSTAVPTDDIEQYSTGGTALRYDSTSGQFVQNWQTPKGPAGSCWRVRLTTDDGTFISADFKLK